MEKQCTQCSEIKDYSQFHKDSKTSDGLRAKCKSCINQNRRKRFAKDPDHERALNKKSRMKPENRVKRIAETIAWKASNPDKVKEHNKKRCDKIKMNPHIKSLNRQLRRIKAIARLKHKQQLKMAYYKSIADTYIPDNKPLVKEWADVKGYEGSYRISNHGEVYSLFRGNILKQTITTYGYYQVNLHRDSKQRTVKVHRIVGAHFVDNPHNKPDINHKDLNKLNNRSDNLEYVTPLENKQHYHAITNSDTMRLGPPRKG